MCPSVTLWVLYQAKELKDGVSKNALAQHVLLFSEDISLSAMLAPQVRCQADCSSRPSYTHCSSTNTFQFKVRATFKGTRQLQCSRLRHFFVYFQNVLKSLSLLKYFPCARGSSFSQGRKLAVSNVQRSRCVPYYQLTPDWAAVSITVTLTEGSYNGHMCWACENCWNLFSHRFYPPKITKVRKKQ